MNLKIKLFLKENKDILRPKKKNYFSTLSDEKYFNNLKN